MKTIKLTKGKEAILDGDDFIKFGHLKWYCDSGGYATRSINEKGKRIETVRLHRSIMSAENGQIVDHINQNRLDNRKQNLRFVTHQENMVNHKLYKNNKYGHHGISKLKNGKYTARMYKDGQDIYLGVFNTLDEAVKKRKQEEVKRR